MASVASVDAYLADLADDRRAALETLRQTIKAAAPEATETIAYDMPAFRMNGHFLVSYAAFKNHYSLFPASGAVIEAIGRELTPYLVGSGTIRFPVVGSNPIPVALVTKVVTIRVAEIAARSKR
jgi:uncharacterized protein YdhG (YjbR/CyaY superfamily)